MTLRVTVEIVPFGEEERKYEIGTLNIHNEGFTGREDEYEYRYEFTTRGYRPEFSHGHLTHIRSDGAWVLVEKALKKIGAQFDLR